MKGRITQITPELREKVIRAYTVKKMSLSMIYKLVCDKVATEIILIEAGIEIKKYKPTSDDKW